MLDEVERIVYPAVGQAGGYLAESEPVSETASVSVDLASGNLAVSNQDLSVEHEGEAEVAPMVLERTYNSLGATGAKSIGPHWGWSTGPSVFLVNYGGTVIVHGRNGYAISLKRVSGSSYASPGEFEGTLTKNSNGTFTLTNADAPTYQFNSAGILTSETPEAGEAETVSDTEVGGATVLHKLTAANGKSLEVGYGTAGLVADVKGPAGEGIFGYNSSNQLTSYTSPSGTKTEYAYSSSNYLDKVVTSEGTEGITTVNGKVSEISDKPTEGPTTVTKYTYEAPQSPTCNPATDAGETVVTTTIEGESEQPTTETSCYNAAGEFTGPKTSAEDEEEGTETPPEESQTCTEDTELHREDCSLEEGAPEEPEDLAKKDYGISDNNWLQARDGKEHFNYLSEPSIAKLHLKEYRRNVPWDMVTEAEHNEEKPGDNAGAAAELEDVEEWIKRVKEASGEPYIAFEDECPTPNPPEWANPGKIEAGDTHPCEQAPTQAQYAQAVEKFLKPSSKHTVLGEVKYFESLNEPNNQTKTEGVWLKPTHSETEDTYMGNHNGAWAAGEYWRALDDMCAKSVREAEHKPECYVAAGDFVDSEMVNAWHKGGDGYAYFHQYVDGMGGDGKAKDAYRWSYHTYEEGEDTRTKYRNKPKQWWKPFRLCQKAVDRVMEHAKYKYPNIWLSEQGVVYFLKEQPLIAWSKMGAAPEIMHAFVEHGSEQLTRQLNPTTKKSQITRFFYYSTRGAPVFDSGLLEAERLIKNEKGKQVELKHRYAANHPRKIYSIFAKKTPGG